MLGVIANKFSIGKETYQPYAAELHYFRIDKRYWSICFERIRRAGFKVIASAVPWNIHQEDTRSVDFYGYDNPRKDLIVFLELAREFGFKVILRPGPWVGGQLRYGGLPKFIFADSKVFARDAEGNELELPDDYGEPGGWLPSYLHRNFQFYLRNYFKAFIEITRNYVHPRGPIFMVELDYETSFGRHLDPASADYNPDILAEFWPQFLQERYEDIKKLNTVYKERHNEFATVEPPRRFEELTAKDYPKVLDWFRFREWILNTYLGVLEDIFAAYTVEPLLLRSLYFPPGRLLPAYNLIPEDRSPFLGCNVFPEGSYFDLVNKARYLKAEHGFAFAASFISGRAAVDPERESQLNPVTNNERRFYLAAALAAGFKGLNHYMFVDRDHWYGAPLAADGTIGEGYETVANFNTHISTVGFDEMDARPKVAMLGIRLYDWLSRTSSKKEFVYVRRLMDQTTIGVCRDLMRYRIDYGIRENREFETMGEYKLVFVPVTEIMATRDQEALVELARSGVSLVLYGVMPKYDEHLRSCQILANHLRLKTTVDYHIGGVSLKDSEFPAHIYAGIRSSDDGKVRKLAKSGTKVVGVCSSRFKGNVYLFTFDIASGGDRRKLALFDFILSHEKITVPLDCSDPSVHLAFQAGEKKGILFVVVPPPGELSDGLETGRKEIIIQVDLKAFGFSAANVKLTNLFGGEENKPIRTTARELKAGLPLEVEYPDGCIFLVERR